MARAGAYSVRSLVELSKVDPNVITLEATVVTGFEQMAEEECTEKCKVLCICKSKGRIYFNIPVDEFPKVLNLRSVDNIFLVNDAIPSMALIKSKEEDLEVMKSLVDKIEWQSSLTTWGKLTGYKGILFPLKEKIVKEDLQAREISPEGNISGLLDNVIGTSQETPQTKVVELDEVWLCVKDFNALHMDEDGKSEDVAVVIADSHEKEKERRGSVSSDDSFHTVKDANSNDELEADLKKECSNSNIYTIAAKEVDEIIIDSQNIVDEKLNDTKCNEKKKNINPNILKFRATCNRTGKHSFSSMEAAATFGGALHDKFNWTVDLSHYDINVILNIDSNNCYICTAITQQSLHRRNISHFGYTTLRSTMCYNMVRLAEPTRGEIIVDPLCGGGSIPIEGSIGFPSTFHICGDNNDKAINNTEANINFNNKKSKRSMMVDPVKWSAKQLPLKDCCIDIIVSDLPFGKRSGKKSDNLYLYKNVLTEMARVTCRGTGRAVLLTYDKNSFIKALGNPNDQYWRQVRNFGVNQGGLFSTVFLLLRTAKAFPVHLHF